MYAAQTLQLFSDGHPFAYDYTDDLPIASLSSEEHRQHLHLVLERLDAHGNVFNASSNVFRVVPMLDFLGYHLDTTGIRLLTLCYFLEGC